MILDAPFRTAHGIIAGATEAEDPPEDVRKGVLEISIGHHIDHGVQRGIEVANPEEDRHHHIWTRTMLLAADRYCQVPGEERQPTYEKGTHNNAQRYEGLVFLAP